MRSSSLLSMLICSSNSECSTTADAPQSSIFRMLPISLQSGDADATSGFFSLSPRYFVDRLVIARCSLRDRRDFRLHFVSIRGRDERHRGTMFVDLPTLVHILLRFLQERSRSLRITLPQHRVTRLVVDVLVERD